MVLLAAEVPRIAVPPRDATGLPPPGRPDGLGRPRVGVGPPRLPAEPSHRPIDVGPGREGQGNVTPLPVKMPRPAVGVGQGQRPPKEMAFVAPPARQAPTKTIPPTATPDPLERHGPPLDAREGHPPPGRPRTTGLTPPRPDQENLLRPGLASPPVGVVKRRLETESPVIVVGLAPVEEATVALAPETAPVVRLVTRVEEGLVRPVAVKVDAEGLRPTALLARTVPPKTPATV